MVSNETLRDIAAVLDDVERDENRRFYDRMRVYEVRRELAKRNKEPDTDVLNNYGNLFMALYHMNISALRARYGDPDDMIQDVAKIPPKPDYSGPIIFDSCPYESLPALYKKIQCYLYQCSESDEIEKSPLYKACRALQNAIASYIVESSPAYENADWA